MMMAEEPGMESGAAEYRRFYVDGRWVPAQAHQSIPVHDSTTESVMARVPSGTAADVDMAVSAACRAFGTWSAVPADVRAGHLERIADGLVQRTDELADVIARETGMVRPLSKAVQVGFAVNSFRQAAATATAYEFEHRLGPSTIVREPVGVVGCITPWNYPLHQLAAKVAYALAAGCTVVAKPSEVAPVSAFILAEIVHEVGLPRGVFNLVTGYGPVVGEAIAGHPLVDMVSFTGSTRAGVRVAQVAAETVKKVALELGGKSANVLVDDLDEDVFDEAVRDGVTKAFVNSGQTCSALTRLLVPRHRLRAAERAAASAVRELVVGSPFEPGVHLGPLASAAQRDRVEGYIRTGIDEGAAVVAGGSGPLEGPGRGYFVRPTVFSDVTPEMTIAKEEIFGPVLVIMPYEDEDDAVRIANDVVYGLSGGVWAADEARAVRLARRLRTGQVTINGARFNVDAPFGGYKQSGVGREYGTFGFEEFLEVKSLQRR